MLRIVLWATAVGLMLGAVIPSAMAGDRRESYSKGPQVKGYAERRGGYSYSASDSINTYGDSRSNFGGTSVFRDPMLDRQTNAGPFDHGFFFDSAIGGRGGDSPYMN